MHWAPRDLDKLIADPKQALDVFDFEPVMKKNVPPAHFGYMATGVDDEVTLRANREGFRKFELRPRRLVDVSKIDMSAEIFGIEIRQPDRDRADRQQPRLSSRWRDRGRQGGEDAATICRCCPRVASTSIEDAIAARGAPVWFQLYTTQRREVGEALVEARRGRGRARDRGDARCAVAAKWETFARLRRTDTRECGKLPWHQRLSVAQAEFQPASISAASAAPAVTNLTWEAIKRLRDIGQGQAGAQGHSGL